MVGEAERAGEPLVAMMIDLDHFKQVNDTHGHNKGDEVLKAVFGIVKVRVKGKGKAYRYGGDEIVMLLPNYTAAEGMALAEVIRGDIERSDVVGDLGVTVSIGVASLPDHATDAAGLLKSADAAMYRAKGLGKNQVASSELSEQGCRH
jgi:diguanylate cyclase (GGDEF)-like protein